MYTIREVCSGALKLVRSMLNRKRKYQIQFNKEKNGCWYVDFPHWPFSHDNLAMVSGADKMLELLSDGELFVRVCVIPANKQEKHEEYIELIQTEHSLFGGSTYQVEYEPFKERFKRDTLWICPVTLFVLGHYPKFIYVKRIEETDKKEPGTITFGEDEENNKPQYDVKPFTPDDFVPLLAKGAAALTDVETYDNTTLVLDITKIWEQNGKIKNVMIPFTYNFYVEAFLNYAKEHHESIFHIQVDEGIGDFPAHSFASLFWPALHMKNIKLPTSFQIILSEIFPWENVKACMDKKIPARANHLSCPFCGRTSEKLEWIEFNSPTWTWRQLCGRRGPLSICPDCHCQVEFICEVMN